MVFVAMQHDYEYHALSILINETNAVMLNKKINKEKYTNPEKGYEEILK